MSAKKVSSQFVRYTVQPKGVWGLIHRLLSIDPSRSSGIPLNAHNRVVAPGANDPNAYDDPVTAPAGDIAENPYWKRDTRRSYPLLSTVTQADAVALLEVGSAAQPKHELVGDAGSQQLVAAQQEGLRGLSVAFAKNTGLAKDVLGPGGMPPLPSGLYLAGTDGGKPGYLLEEEQSYPSRYPCRSFA